MPGMFLTHYSFLSALLSFLFILKLTHSTLLSSTPYIGDGYYFHSYLCPLTVLPLSSYMHIFISLHPHRITPPYSQQVDFSSYLLEPEITKGTQFWNRAESSMTADTDHRFCATYATCWCKGTEQTLCLYWRQGQYTAKSITKCIYQQHSHTFSPF